MNSRESWPSVLIVVGLIYTVAARNWSLWLTLPVAIVLALVVRTRGAVITVAIGRYHVPGNKVGIVRRGYGKSDPTFKSVTPHDRVGLQAKVLLPNHVYWLTPAIYHVEYVDATYIPEDHLGVVTALEGNNRPRDRTVGVPVECDNFQDGQRFLLSGGEQGGQIATLAGGQTYYLNPYLFQVEIVPRTFVPSGTIGLVSARSGRVPAQGARFGKHVECDNFQDGQAFLDAGGEQGRQLAILPGGGAYDINPRLFSVTTVHYTKQHEIYVNQQEAQSLTVDQLRDVHVPIGKTGVVVTLDGVEPERDGGKKVGPRISGHQNFRLPWVFRDNGGTRGVQEETIDGGSVFALNPWFVRVVCIPTRVLQLEWKNKTETQFRSNYDAELARIAITIQGYRLRVNMEQRVRIPETSAPRLVSEFGEVESLSLGGRVDDPLPIQRFVEKVLGGTVEAYFSEIAAESTIKEFLDRYGEIRTDLTDRVRNELARWEVEAIDTTLGLFEAEDPELNKRLQNVAGAQIDSDALAVELENTKIEDQIDAIEVNREKRRAAIELQAQLQAQIEALGPNNAAMIHIIRELTDMQVPNYIGGGDIGAVVEALPVGTLQNLIGQLDKLRPVAEGDSAPRPQLQRESEPPADPPEDEQQ